MRKVFDSLGYAINFSVLNAVDFGIPQVRNRLFVVGYHRSLKKAPQLPSPSGVQLKYDMHQFLESNCRLGNFTCSPNG